MQFTWASAVLMAMVRMDKHAGGGWHSSHAPRGRWGSLRAGSAARGSVRLESSMSNVLATLPFLFVYPVALASITYGLGRSVAMKNRQLERLNRIDVVTGLLNRRGWNETLAAELARHARTRRPAVLMLVDVDGFKAVTSGNGHMAGEAGWRVSSVLSDCTREIDTRAIRPRQVRGLRQRHQGRALSVAERVRTVFLAERTAEAAAEGCTVSIGLAQADLSVVTPDEWLTRADTAMYRAKAGGRNRVEPHGVLAGQLY